MTRRRSGYFGQRALLWSIRWYRAKLSGRGPLAQVRCTFEGTESCSRYGERVAAHHAKSLLHAASLIHRRLRRCREASLFLDDGMWSGGELYDDGGGDLDEALAAAFELDSSRALALRSGALIAARVRRDARAAKRQLAAAAALASPDTAPPLIVRLGSSRHALERRLRRRFLLLLLVALLLGACFGLLFNAAVGLVAGGLLGLSGGGWQLQRWRRRREQLEALAAARHFGVGGQPVG